MMINDKFDSQILEKTCIKQVFIEFLGNRWPTTRCQRISATFGFSKRRNSRFGNTVANSNPRTPGWTTTGTVQKITGVLPKVADPKLAKSWQVLVNGQLFGEKKLTTLDTTPVLSHFQHRLNLFFVIAWQVFIQVFRLLTINQLKLKKFLTWSCCQQNWTRLKSKIRQPWLRKVKKYRPRR